MVVTIDSGPSISGVATFSYRFPRSVIYRISAASLLAIDTSFVVHFASAGAAPMTFTDGRCNQYSDQPVSFYPDGFGGYDLYETTKSGSQQTFLHVSKNQLAANPPRSDDYLIALDRNLPLFRLSDGSLQTQRLKSNGELYAFKWTQCGWVVS